MTAQIIVLPVIHRPHLDRDDYREQIVREREGLNAYPFRTRPLLVVDNPAQAGRAVETRGTTR